MAELTFSQVDAVLKCNPETGELFWKERTTSMFSLGRLTPETNASIFNQKFAGKAALNAISNSGYRKGRVLGRCSQAHRVVWLLCFGEWPADQIDHINGNRSDNRIVNLRCVTASENGRNAQHPKRSKSGAIGVRHSRATTKDSWQARITVGGKVISLGVFSTVEEAVFARQAAQKAYGFTDRHGYRTTT